MIKILTMLPSCKTSFMSSFGYEKSTVELVIDSKWPQKSDISSRYRDFNFPCRMLSPVLPDLLDDLYIGENYRFVHSDHKRRVLYFYDRYYGAIHVF